MIRRARQQKTTLVTNETVTRDWYHVNAEGKVLGRLATEIAMILMGKHRPDYTQFVDTGDFVIITNVDKVVMTGTKLETKFHDYYTYHPGGHRYTSYSELMQTKPEFLVRNAIRRMLPKNKLANHMLSKLKIYRGANHPHAAQQPRELEIN